MIEHTFPFLLTVGTLSTQERGRHALDAICCWAARQGRMVDVRACGRGTTMAQAEVTWYDTQETVCVESRLLGPDEVAR